MGKARMVMGIPLLLLLVGAEATTRPTPPPQPADGPGGGKYPFGGLSMHRYGEGGGQYWIFEPADPIPKSAPVIIFNHGWTRDDAEHVWQMDQASRSARKHRDISARTRRR